jgi:nicotinate-nucleotide pyrophosphorylase (carboxylating)
MSFRTIQGGAAPRSGVTKLPHDRSDLLWSGGEPTPLFLDSIDRWVDAMVADEHGGGEGPDGLVEATITAKARGILCGRPVVQRLLDRHYPECTIHWRVLEGGAVTNGDTLATLLGSAIGLLRLERIMLNILGRLSGIATNTARWVAAARPIRVAATRKTEWGLLDKWAVHIGGGLTHRLDRGDALMLKENDLAAMTEEGEDMIVAIQRAISSIDMDTHAEFTVIEVQEFSHAIAAAKAWKESQLARGGDEKLVIMLDNMEPSITWQVNRSLNRYSDLGKYCILEASGGIVFESLEDWRGVGEIIRVRPSGVHLVSSSALNMGVPSLDMSMLIGGGE